MATHKSALKRARQSVKRQTRNKTRKSSVAALVKKVLAAPKDEAVKLLSQLQKTIDKASRKGTLHWKTAARKVSRIAKAVSSKG